MRRADADRVRAVTGYAIGGVPPFAHVQRLRTLIDEDLRQFDTVWAAAGTSNTVFAIAPEVLARITGGQSATLKIDVLA